MELPGRRVWEAMTNADPELAVRVEEPRVKMLGATPDVARSAGEGDGAGLLELCCVFVAGSTLDGFDGGSAVMADVKAGNGSAVLVAVLGVGDDPACALVVMSGSAVGSLAAVVEKGESPFPEVKV
jgi:hypothetical protein